MKKIFVLNFILSSFFCFGINNSYSNDCPNEKLLYEVWKEVNNTDFGEYIKPNSLKGNLNNFNEVSSYITNEGTYKIGSFEYKIHESISTMPNQQTDFWPGDRTGIIRHYESQTSELWTPLPKNWNENDTNNILVEVNYDGDFNMKMRDFYCFYKDDDWCWKEVGKTGYAYSVEKEPKEIKNGTIKTYYDNGNIKEIANYSANLLNGDYKLFFEDGTIKKSGVYNEGEAVGEWILSWSTDELITYVFPILEIDNKEVDPYTDLKIEKFYHKIAYLQNKNNAKNRSVKFQYLTGEKFIELKNKKMTFYYRNGNIYAVGKINKDDEAYGFWEVYNEDGSFRAKVKVKEL